MKSMTGYGWSESHCAGFRVKVEILSVNKKGLEVNFNLPRELMALEVELRDLLQKKVSRGKISINISVWQQGAKAAHLPICEATLRKHNLTLRKIARSLGCSEELPLPFLLELPGVMIKKEMLTLPLHRAIIATAQKALVKLLASRTREGSYLSDNLLSQLAHMEQIIKRITSVTPKITARYRQNLVKRMKDSGVNLAANDERVIKEIALFEDRTDVTEEITRLTAHLKEIKRLLASHDPAGRNLDFLIQEINRETNTIGSKANGLEISKQVIALKAELEKMREQVQNLE